MSNITSTELGATGRYIYFDQAALDDLGSQTVLTYCRPTGSGGAGFGYIYGKTGTGATNGPRFFIDHNSGSPRLSFGAHSAAAGLPQSYSAAGAVTYGNWQHLAYSWTGALDQTGIVLYINGVVSDFDDPTADGSGSIASDAANPAYLMNRFGLGRELIGDVAYVAVWDRVLTGAELETARADGPLEVPTGLVLLWANQGDLSPGSLTATGRSTFVAGAIPPITALGGGVIDTTAPALSSPSGTQTGASTATLSFTTNEANGTMYAVVTTSATPPSVAQVKAGQNNGGSPAVYAANQAISTTGAKIFSAAGLTAATTYYAYAVQTDAAANDSGVSATASFTTTAALIKGAQLTLYNGVAALASLTAIRAMWWDADLPSGAPAYESTSHTTDVNGLFEIDLSAVTSLSVGSFGFLFLYKLDSSDYRDSLVFASKIAVVDIS